MSDGFDDLFEGVSFPDASIASDGSSAVVEGQKSDSPPDDGQPADSQPVQEKAKLDKSVNNDQDTKDKDDKGKPGDDIKDKSLPFDQDPKWKKARAAEAVLEDIMKDYGYLDADELREALNSGKSLKDALADQDVETLKKDSAAHKEYQKRMEEEAANDPENNPEPDERMKKLLEENKVLKADLNGIMETNRSEEADAESYKQYSSDVDKILELTADDVPLNDVETTLFKEMMGIENASTEVDIDDKKSVRTMVRTSLPKFKATLEMIKQDTIDKYAAGKSKMVVTDPTKSADLDSTILNKKNYDASKQSVDQVLDSGKDELKELILQGITNAP